MTDTFLTKDEECPKIDLWYHGNSRLSCRDYDLKTEKRIFRATDFLLKNHLEFMITIS